MRINLQLHKALSGKKTKGVSVKKPKTETKTALEDKKTITMPPMATTISEANEIAVKYGLAKTADFKYLDIKRVNVIIQTMAATKAEFPAMAVPDFVGNPFFCGDPAEVNRAKDKQKINTAIAWVSSGGTGKVKGLYFMPKKEFGAYFYNDQEVKKSLENAVKIKFHPESCNTLKSIVDHELGHVLDRTVDKAISFDSRVMKLYSKHVKAKKESDKMENVLSKYAEKTVGEFVAEAWTEYRNNPTPRPLATEVGKIIESYFKKS
ncbi:MAG: hypothetical protein IJP96_06950 [Synergistaceae bacterium]|nr:hypothetical protein [Synergistaceae bacterium]